MDTGGGSTFASDAHYCAVSAVVQHCYYLINNLLFNYYNVVTVEGLHDVKRRGFSEQQVGLHLLKSHV